MKLGIAIFSTAMIVALLPSPWQWLFILAATFGWSSWVEYWKRFQRQQILYWWQEHLPTSLTIGTETFDDMVHRILDLWVDSEQMSSVLSHIHEGVLVVSAEGVVLLANSRARKILKLGARIEQSTIDSDKIPEVIQDAIQQSQEGVVFEDIWLMGLKPERRYYEVLGLPLEGNGSLLVLRDITKIRRLERVRRDFVANISHELRTPITTIMMNVEALLQGTENLFLTAIQRNSQRLNLLVNGLLDLSRIEAGQYELTVQQTTLKPLIDRVVLSLEEKWRQKQQSIHVNIPSDLQAFVDIQAMEHVLTNLLENAIKYTPQTSEIWVEGIVKKKSVRLEVRDNGTGIPAKHLPRLFERFYRVDKGRSREAGGTGLGLSIVKHLVESMGGEVGVYNATEGGAVFWMTLPLTSKKIKIVHSGEQAAIVNHQRT